MPLKTEIDFQGKLDWAGKVRGSEVIIRALEQPNFEARIALAMIERWGCVAGIIDGEDSAGRSRARNATPKELVERACDTAEGAVKEFRERGWIEQLPTGEEARAVITERAAESKQQDEAEDPES